MMNQSDIFKKIGAILNELQEQYEFLAQNPEQLNELELELFQANANFLSDHMEIVRKLNASKVVRELPQFTGTAPKEAEQVPAKAPVPEYIPVVDDLPEPKDYSFFDKPAELVDYVREEPAVEAPTFEFILNDRPETDKFDYEEKSVEAIFDRPLSKEEERIIAEKQRLLAQQHHQQKVNEAEQVLGEPEEKEALSSNVRPTLNDLLASKGNSPGQKEAASKPPIASLKGAINLNEKLLYIKDLFNGYNLAYSEAIDLIDKMQDFKTAEAFLKNSYAEKNNWQAKQSTVDQFHKLLARRFPNDKD